MVGLWGVVLLEGWMVWRGCSGLGLRWCLVFMFSWFSLEVAIWVSHLIWGDGDMGCGSGKACEWGCYDRWVTVFYEFGRM